MLQQTVCALRFLYRNTLGKEWALPYIPTPRREKRLPVVLSQEEVSRFFDNLPNLKHRALIMTAYATGMRVSEVVCKRKAGYIWQRARMRAILPVCIQNEGSTTVVTLVPTSAAA
jgi:integrase/recombinase XerD